MKKGTNMHHDPMIGRVAIDMLGFTPISMALAKTESDYYSLNSAQLNYDPAQITLNESKFMKFLRNL